MAIQHTDFVYRSTPISTQVPLTIFQDDAYPQLMIIYDSRTATFRKYLLVDDPRW